MELQMEKQKQVCFEQVLDRTVEESFTADAVVPDALADVGGLLLTEGDFCLWRLDLSDGAAELEGAIQATVCYTEEQTGAVAGFPVEVPVQLRIAAETLSPEVRPFAVCRVSELSAQLMNSRKVRVRARLCVRLCGYRAGMLELTQGVAPSEQAVFTNRTPCRFDLPVAVEEQVFTSEETHPFRLSRPEDGRLLSSSAAVQLEETKFVGGKVILQGKVVTTVLYRQPERTAPVTESFETPFSQLIEASTDAALHTVRAQIQLTSAELTVRPEEQALQTVYHLVAQLVCMTELECDSLSDAYSNVSALELTMQEQRFAQYAQLEPLRAEAEDRIPCETQGMTVCGSRASLRAVSVENGAVSGAVDVAVLLQSQEGTVTSVRRELRFSQPAETAAMLLAARPEEAYLSLDAEGVAVRVPVRLELLSAQEQTLRQVTEICVGDKNSALDALPSVTLVRADASPDLWALAKRYCSSVEAIRSANPAQEDDDARAFLLLPKVRA